MAKTKSVCIMEYLRSSDPKPTNQEILALKRAAGQEEWDSYYDQLPKEFQKAD